MTALAEAAALLEQGQSASLARMLDSVPDAAMDEVDPKLFAAAIAALIPAGELDRALALVGRARALGLMLPFPTTLFQALQAAGRSAQARDLVQGHSLPADAAPWQFAHQANLLLNLGLLADAEAMLARGLAVAATAPPLLATRARLAFMTPEPPPQTAAWCRAAAVANPDAAAQFRQMARLMDEGQADTMGFSLHLPRSTVAPDIAMAILSGSYEAGERRAVVQDLRSDDRVLELGTGIGIIALSLARARPDLPVVTVEANPALEPVIRANFMQNGCKAELICGLAGLTEGAAPFHVSRNFAASSTRDPGGPSQQITVPTVDVAGLIARHRPTILICDIEGGEVDILCAIPLDGLRRLIVEFHPGLCPAAQISTTVAHLLAAGFHLDLAACTGPVLIFDRPDGTAC